VKALNERQFFIWLAIQDRCRTSDRLHRHGLGNNGPCALRSQESKTIGHLLLAWVFSREVSFKTLAKCSWQRLVPGADDEFSNWWIHHLKAVTKARRKAFDLLLFLVFRSLWLERNARVFMNKALPWTSW
jgi:hypothetical protein